MNDACNAVALSDEANKSSASSAGRCTLARVRRLTCWSNRRTSPPRIGPASRWAYRRRFTAALLRRLNDPRRDEDEAMTDDINQRNPELPNTVAGLKQRAETNAAEAAALREALITRTAHLSSMTGPRPVCLACNKMGEQSGTEIPHAPDCIVADSSTAGARLLAERKRLRESARLTQDYFDDTLHGTIQFSEEEQERVFQAAVDALAVPGETNE